MDTNRYSRRAFLKWMGWSMAALTMPGCGSTLRGRSGNRANIVVVLCDDLGYGDLGCFGNTVIQTPHLDSLAREGMRLTDCYSAAPVCSPARVGMLTGRTPNRVGVYDWIPNDHPMHLRSSEVTVATLLQQAGYQTCHVGKWHCNGKFNSEEQPQPDDHGFDYWFSTQNNALLTHYNPVNFVRNGRETGQIEGYSSTIIVQEAIDWLGTHRDPDKPFCLFVWFHAPHEPIATADEFMDLYPEARERGQKEYYGNVTQMDHEFGRLMETLDAMQLRDDTFILFTSDNGPETLNRYRGSWRSHGSPGVLRGMKLWLYEGGIRVPGMVCFPGKIRPGQECHEPVCGVDVLPTLCEIAGIDPPSDRELDGASLVPVFTGKKVKRTKPLYWQYNRALGKNKVAIRDGDWKLLANADLTEFELYNLALDVREKRNRAPDQPQRIKRMVEVMRSMHQEILAEGPQW
ncbi:MAG: sulfatase-like hydrolase/transferase [Sedimentisphaerales bacterium]|nr:sulfatase-like hydrolase/transferase [Sedimentisphaerales bacterium]